MFCLNSCGKTKLCHDFTRFYKSIHLTLSVNVTSSDFGKVLCFIYNTNLNYKYYRERRQKSHYYVTNLTTPLKAITTNWETLVCYL